MNNKYSFLVLVLIIFYIETGTSLECYTCVSSGDSACGSNFDPSKVIAVPCLGDNSVCVKIVAELGEYSFVTRMCGKNTSCESNDSCYICTTDKCNSSSNLRPQFWLLPLLGLALIKSFI